ncbi:MAG: polysaccharide biosynthesis tyrosine autokinase [Sphingomonadales bacterium]|nr:polysaccharide biosynthesis tyrosine autokinase [Sphingomonadales bacterium]MDE2171660.1 polysaccharide biosynthesis tyrosine autokinase [Sphingomonadales bacterium]
MNDATRPRATAPQDAKPVRGAVLRDPMDGVRRAMAALRRRRWLALIYFVVVVALVGAFGVTRTKLYTASTNMVVNSRELNLAEKDKEVLPGLSTSDNAADTEIEIMRSTAVAQGTVHALGLVDHPAFAEKLAKLPPSAREDEATAILMGNLKIMRPGQSNVVVISYTSPDPALSKAVADQIGHQYLAVKLASRREAVEQVDRGLGNELDILRVQLEQADAAVADYRARHNLFDSSGSGQTPGQNTTFTQQELSLYKQQAAAAAAAATDARAKLATANGQSSSGSAGGVGAVLQSPVIQQLRAQRSQLAATYNDMASRYQPEHPDMIRTKEQLDALDKAIAAETSRQLQNLRANARIAEANAAGASGIVAKAAATLESDTKAAVQLGQLQRKADGLRDTYNALLQRKNSISSQALVADEDARIFSPAVLPLRPSSPNRLLILIIGLALGAIMAGGAVWIAEAFDRKLVSSADIEREFGLPHIANMPETSSIADGVDKLIAPVDFPRQRPHSLYAEQLRSVRHLLIHKDGRAITTAGITSARPGEGKTTFAVSLARTAALGGTRTLLVDADLRKPTVASTLGLTPGKGTAEVLSGAVSLADAVVRDETTGMMVLAAQQNAGGQRQDLFTPAHIAALIAAAREQQYELVIFDCSPLLAVSDMRLLLRQVDDVLLMLRWNFTPRQSVDAALKRMRLLDIEPLGVVATRVDMAGLSAFGHGDVDRDHMSYGDDYA